MEYRKLGDSGCKVSTIALGTWLNFGSYLHERSAQNIVRASLEAGVNFIDTADVYDQGRAESQLGTVLEGVPRKDYVLASKVFFPTGEGPNDRGLSRKHIFETVHASLKRLQTDYLDLLQCHRYDEETPVAETVRAFADLIRQGKILYWGVSLWTADQIREAVAVASDLNAPPPVSNQPPYHLLDRTIEAEVMPACREHGLTILPYSPLAQGVLSGKYLEGARPHDSRATDERRGQFMQRYLEDAELAKVKEMAELAREAELAPAQLALAWLLHRPEVASVIIGVTKMPQLEENLRAAEAKLDDDLVGRLEAIFPVTAA